MDALLISVLLLAGLAVGATGTWSPCGLSMIETIGPKGHEDGPLTTAAACATFLPAAVLGGAATFGLLAAAGETLGAGSRGAFIAAAVVALAAAVAEARGLPIVPQVRRQLPVGWRARMPMPLAAAGYGVLLGLGFTTFILSYGVWALMGVALAAADPLAGLALGVAFGLGRAVPIVVLAPIADRPGGRRACDAMAMRPGLYRGARAGDAALLAGAAVVLLGSAGAQAARDEQPRAFDPSAQGGAVVFERNDGSGAAGPGVLLRAGGKVEALPGTDPATGGGRLAVVDPPRIRILDRRTLEEVGRLRARGADGIAIDEKWIAYRQRRSGRDKLKFARLSGAGQPGASRVLARSRGSGQLSRPTLDGRKLLVAIAKRRRSRLVRYRLGAGAPKRRSLLSSRDALITAPSISGRRIAYVQSTKKRQSLRLKGLGRGKGRSIYRRGNGGPTLWSTALVGARVWVTLLRRNGTSKLISVGR